MSKYAKAIAGALTVIVVFVVGQFGLDLPPEVVTAVGTLLTALVVWAVPNAQEPSS